MITVLTATGPIFLIIAIGYALARFGALSAEQVRGMGGFVIQVAMPALIIQSFTQRPVREIVDLHYLAVYGGAGLSLLSGAFLAYRRALGVPMVESAVRALGTAAPNSGFVGFPIALQLVGPAAGVGLALCMLVENLLIIPGALALAEAGAAGGGSARTVIVATAKRLVRTPLIAGIVIGFAISALDLHLPSLAARTLAILAGASAPLALIVIGGTLSGLRVGGVLAPAVPIAAAKLLLMPLVALALLQVLPVADPDLRHALLIYAAAPMLSIYTVIGQRFGLGALTAAALLVATVGSFFTVSALLLLLQ